MPRWLKIVAAILGILVLAAIVATVWSYNIVNSSLPILDGSVAVAGLTNAVTIERDAAGVPTITGTTREDVARGLGFLHAQERYFQMDLLRRQAAGELSELVGAAALESDRASRLHQFRRRSREAVAGMPPAHRAVLSAYTEGVNAGLTALDSKPFEYFLLQADPEPWRDEDSTLALFAMYFVLNDATGRRDSDMGLLDDVLGPEMAAFLAPEGTEWDAPIHGAAFETPPIPWTAPVVPDGLLPSNDHVMSDTFEASALVGSNNWAVGGSRTAHGRAILANDMHLGMMVPNTWYRARLVWPANDDCGKIHDLTGVTLPGSPALSAGSTTRIAWGFTNSQGDWSDLVILETSPDDDSRYLTPDGWRTTERVTETITVKGGEPKTLEIEQTIWGPVVGLDHLGRRRAVRWIAHDPGAANLGLLDLEHAGTVEDAFEIAHRTGIPPQNFVCADAGGSIGWTIIGRIPNRFGFSGRVPTSWAVGTRGWNGWLDHSGYPAIVDPPDGLIWTANARVVSGEMLAVVGHGGYDLGARAQQIRDHLLEIDTPVERDMLEVHLDDRAIFLARWRDLLLDLLDEAAIEGDPERAEFRDLVERTWTGRASIDSASFRLVRAFRTFTFEHVYDRLTAPCEEADERFNIHRIHQSEGPLWRLVTERPEHLADPMTGSWREELLALVDSTITYYEELEGELADHTWGARNTLSMQHPLSAAVPMLSRWLDMPAQPLPGDSDMPRVQSPGWGASERFAVSPGHEDEGYFHMPAGQSGHPLSPFYRAGHQDWVEGNPTPFLPGPTVHRLELHPPR